MDLINLLIVLAIIGTAWWLFNTYVPAPAPVKTVATVVVCLIMIVMLLEAVMGGGGFRLGRL